MDNCSKRIPLTGNDEEHATITGTVSSDGTHAGAKHFCRTVWSVGGLGPGPRVFVAGCGKGHEALFIRRELGDHGYDRYANSLAAGRMPPGQSKEQRAWVCR
jgi:hypothetical protein